MGQMGTFLNFVAVAYNSSTALPFGTVIVILLILTLGQCKVWPLGLLSGCEQIVVCGSELPAERDWRHLGTQLLHAPRCTLQDHKDSARDTSCSLVSDKSTRTLILAARRYLLVAGCKAVLSLSCSCRLLKTESSHCRFKYEVMKLNHVKL